MLGQAVFWLVVADTLPATGTSPLLSDYIRINFIVGSMGIMLSVITVSIHHQAGPLKNRFLRKLFIDILPRIVFVSTPVRSKKSERDRPNGTEDIANNGLVENKVVSQTNKDENMIVMRNRCGANKVTPKEDASVHHVVSKTRKTALTCGIL